jgi:hypothetical protein
MFHDLMDLEPGRLEHREPFTWADLTLSATALRATADKL